MKGSLGMVRQRRSIVATPILIPENQRPPFPRPVGRVSVEIRSHFKESFAATFYRVFHVCYSCDEAVV